MIGIFHVAQPLAALCAGAQSSALDPVADQSFAIHSIWHLMLWICVPMYLFVMAAVGAMLWRARRLRRSAADVSTADERTLSIGLGAWTALIVVGLCVLTTGSFLVDRQLIPRGDAALNIRVTGKQWWWQVEYLDDDPSKRFITANELHIPVGRKTHIELRSDDVIHSFWVPNLSGKRDLIPGRINHLELTPRQTGSYRGPCAEFCGLQHAKMAILVDVDEDAAFESWRAQQLKSATDPTTDAQKRGARVFVESPCVMCHAIRGTQANSLAGPDLTHLASRSTLAAGTLPMGPGSLAAWLADPQRQKPGTNMPSVDLEPDQLNALVAYLLSLK